MLSGVEDEMTSDAADDIELAQFPKLVSDSVFVEQSSIYVLVCCSPQSVSI